MLCVDTYLGTRDQILKRIFHPWALQDLFTGDGKPLIPRVRGRRISYDDLFALLTAWWPGTHPKTRFISILNCQRPIKWVRSWLSDSLVVSSPQKKHHGLRWFRTWVKPSPWWEWVPSNIRYAMQWMIAKHLRPSGYQDKGYQFEGLASKWEPDLI